MSKPVKTKLCWNCEGSVTKTADNCPFCGVYLSPESTDKEPKQEEEPRAPYKPQKVQKEIPKAPYNPVSQAAQEPQLEAEVDAAVLEIPATSKLQAVLFPLVALTTGLLFLFFSSILFLFATAGKLTLEWDAEFWYIYAFIGVPLLFFGWKFLDNVE